MRIVRHAYDYSVAGKSKGRLDVKVKFNDGRTYIITFLDKETASQAIDTAHNGCFIQPALLLIDEASMSRVREVLHDIVHSGYFDHLVPVDDEQLDKHITIRYNIW